MPPFPATVRYHNYVPRRKEKRPAGAKKKSCKFPPIPV